MREAKIREFLTLKPKSMSVHDYGLKFIQLSRDASEIVTNIRRMISLFVVGLSHYSGKEGKETMLIGYTDIIRLMIHVQ